MLLFMSMKTDLFHGLLIFLLALGIIPEQTNALQCYTCDNCDKPDNSSAASCGDGESCFNSGAKRGCYSKDKVDCIKNQAGGDCYKPEADPDKAIAWRLKDCLGEEPKGQTCVCATDLCNNLQTSGGTSNSSAGHVAKEVNCYLCNDKKGSDCDRALHMVEGVCPSGYCRTIREPISGMVERSCDSALHGECFIKTYGGENNTQACRIGFGDLKKASDLAECIYGNTSNPKSRSKDDKERNECVCTGDFCNEAAGTSPTSLLITIIAAHSFFLYILHKN